MKTIKSMSISTKAIIQGILLSLILLGIPLQAWSYPENEGDKSYIEEWMTQPFEINPANYEAELMVEDWMTQPFEINPANYEAELSL